MKRIIFFLIFLLTFKLLAASNPDIHQVLQQAYNRGEITKAQELYYRLASLYDRELVPESYQNYIHAVSRMGTSLKLEAFFEMPNMTQAERANFEIFFQRPSQSFLEKSLISPYGLFEIHYTSLGQHAATDDFIQQVAEAFDHVYDVEINTLGYNPPPIDDIASPEYDVYVYDINGYGATTPENSVPSTGRDDYTSWIEIDNDFSEVSTTGIPGMLVTAAHEFFHMIHLGYRGYSGTLMNPIFLYEMSSTWMEDFVHDDINDYYYYLPSLFNNFDLPFYTTNGIKEYGQGIFIHMLVEKYGNKVVKDIWEAYVTREALDAIDFALQSHGSSLKNEMADFTIWNYFTGNRADTVNYYPEGKHYPEFDPEQELTVNSSLDITDTVKKQSFNYYQITPDFTASYYIQPAFANPENWMFSVIVDPQTSTRDFFTNVYSGNAVANLAQVSSISKMFICPIYANIPEPGDYYNSETFAMEIVKGVGMDSNSEILIVKPNPFLVGKHDDVKIIFNLNETSDAKATIYTEHGIKVKEITELCPSGTNEFKWDGTNEDGEGVVSGVYLVIIEANTILGPEKIALIR